MNIREKLEQTIACFETGIAVSDDDIFDVLTEVSVELDKVTNDLVLSLQKSLDVAEAWQSIAESRQAQIDSLMLEFCPDEMTPEQLQEWARHQQPSYFQPSKESQ